MKDDKDGWVKDGYTLEDVLKIEKINEDGSAEVVYDSGTADEISPALIDRGRTALADTVPNKKAFAKALDISESKALSVLQKLAVAGSIKQTRKGGFRRWPSGDEDALTFIMRRGGVRDDAGHNLGKGGRDFHKVFKSNEGNLIRKTGMSVEEAGFVLWEGGYIDRIGELADRPPTEAESLEIIEDIVGTPRFLPGEGPQAGDAAEQADLDEAINRLGIDTTGMDAAAQQEAVEEAQNLELLQAEADEIAQAYQASLLEAEVFWKEYLESRGDAWVPEIYDAGRTATLADMEAINAEGQGSTNDAKTSEKPAQEGQEVRQEEEPPTGAKGDDAGPVGTGEKEPGSAAKAGESESAVGVKGTGGALDSLRTQPETEEILVSDPVYQLSKSELEKLQQAFDEELASGDILEAISPREAIDALYAQTSILLAPNGRLFIIGDALAHEGFASQIAEKAGVDFQSRKRPTLPDDFEGKSYQTVMNALNLSAVTLSRTANVSVGVDIHGTPTQRQIKTINQIDALARRGGGEYRAAYFKQPEFLDKEIGEVIGADEREAPKREDQQVAFKVAQSGKKASAKEQKTADTGLFGTEEAVEKSDAPGFDLGSSFTDRVEELGALGLAQEDVKRMTPFEQDHLLNDKGALSRLNAIGDRMVEFLKTDKFGLQMFGNDVLTDPAQIEVRAYAR